MSDIPRAPRPSATGRMGADLRKRQLLDAAMRLALRHGYQHVTRDMVAAATRTSPGLLSRYWTAPGLRTAMVEEAIASGNLAVLVQALAAQHPAALAAPRRLRRAAAATLVTP